jgi:diguanylate cyclase (GGDEF)-like protein
LHERKRRFPLAHALHASLHSTQRHARHGELRACLRGSYRSIVIAGLRSVRTRIVAFFAILIVLVQGSAFLLVNAANSDNARRVTDSELATGERIVQRALDDDRHALLQLAGALAGDPALREAINRREQASIARILEAQRTVLDASSMQLLTSEGKVVATSGRGEGDATFVHPRLLDEARRNGEVGQLRLVEARLHHVVLVPVASSPVTWIAITRPLKESWVRDVSHVAALEVSFAARNADDWIVAMSTLSPESRDALGKRVSVPNGTRDVRAQIALEGRDFQNRLFDIDTTPGHEVVAVLQRPLGDTLARFDQLRTLLMGLAAVSLGGTLIGSIFIARGITDPLAKLAKSAARISRGDYSQTIDISTRDEIGSLANALNRMREGIASHEQEILRLAYEDRVTGLPNRALFNDRLAGAVNLARRTGEPLTVMLMDLDRFKHINDTLGHSVGDYVLREVGTRLRGALRESDTIARLGGDEFGMLLPTGNEERISEVVRKILRCIEQPIECEGQCLDVGASIGIARFPDHGDKPDTLISRADVAMYLAKAANSEFAYYDASHHGAHQEQLSLLGELRRAVERNELRVYFQPKIDLRSGQTKGVEALVRWMHPSRGIVPPIEFMPFAERTGFVRTVTRFVLETALVHCGQWLEHGMRLQVSVNISVRDLQNTDLPDIVQALLSKCAVPPELVCLEITESSFMENPQRALHTLGRLRALGIRLSIDDFGTGFSSLAYLRKLRVHEIKVDRTFIAAMEDGDDMVIVRSTVELAHNLGLTVVAEGIEDERSLARLRAMGCDEAQGFFMSRPLPEDKLIEWLKTSPYGLERPGERALTLLRYG